MRIVHVAAAALLLTLTLCQGETQRPRLSESACWSTFNGLSQNDLLTSLTPCTNGASAECCEAGQNLAGFRANAPLAGCLCYRNTLENLIINAESNSLARSAGVNRAWITSTLQQCGTPYYGGTGKAACPQSTPPPSSSQPSSPAPTPQLASKPSALPSSSQPPEAPTQPPPQPPVEPPKPPSHPYAMWLDRHPYLRQRFQYAQPMTSGSHYSSSSWGTGGLGLFSRTHKGAVLDALLAQHPHHILLKQLQG